MSPQQIPSPPPRKEQSGQHLPGELIRSIAPMPTERTVRQRTSFPMQAYRFTAVTWKMLKIIGRTHKH